MEDRPPPLPLLIAHRGESFDAPENTLAAINLAWERGAEAVEVDVHLTSNRRLLTIHDRDTQRTGGAIMAVAEHTAEALRALDVGRWKDARWAGERAPLLEEVLATVPRPGAQVFIEVKVGPEATEALAAAVAASGVEAEQVVVIAFGLETCASVKRRLPGVRVCYLSGFKRDEATGLTSPSVDELIARATGAGLDGLDVAADPVVDAAFVARVKAVGLRLYVWTVDDPRRAAELVAAGVDGITTNRPAWLRQQLMRQGPGRTTSAR